MLPVILLAGGLLSYTGFKLYKQQTGQHGDTPPPVANLEQTEETEEETLSSAGQSLMLLEQADFRFKVSTITLTVTSLGILFYPPLLFPALLGFTYLSLPLLDKGIQAIRKKRGFDWFAVYVVASISLLFSGYYFTTALNYWFYYFGQTMMARIRSQSRNSLLLHMIKLPEEVWLVKQGSELAVSIQQLMVGDTIMVRSGEMIPIDGRVLQGAAKVDSALLNGDSSLLDTTLQDRVYSGMRVVNGELYIQIEQTALQSALQKLENTLAQAADTDFQNFALEQNLMLQFALSNLMMGSLPLSTNRQGMLPQNAHESVCFAVPLPILSAVKMCWVNGILSKNTASLPDLSQVDVIIFEHRFANRQLFSNPAFHRFIYDLQTLPGQYDLHLLAEGRDLNVQMQGQDMGIRQTHAVKNSADKLFVLKSLAQKGRKVCFIGTDKLCLQQAHISVCIDKRQADTEMDWVLLNQPFKQLNHLWQTSQRWVQQNQPPKQMTLMAGLSMIEGMFLIDMQLLTNLAIYNESLLSELADNQQDILSLASELSV